ncbi:MAG: histidine phosphatase family protein [Pseudomonadota bacterium]
MFRHTLYFVRHGETDWNAAGRFQGQTETDLNARGRAQAARNGDELRTFLQVNGIAELPVFASPMRRVQQTVAIIMERLGREMAEQTMDDRLKEISFGRLEGMTRAEMKAADPTHDKTWRRDRWNVVPPEGESYAVLSARVASWLATVDQDAVVVSHGGVSRALRGLVLGLAPEDIPGLATPQDQIMRLGPAGCDWF